MAGKGDKSNPNISDEERSELMKKMDTDLEKHFKELEEKAIKRLEDGPKRMDGGWTEDNWEEEMQQHPFFNQGWKEGEALSPLMQGMQDLKYSPEENTKEELAINYKEDGNFNFKCKKYRFAVASYTEGLRAKSANIEVNTQLLTNRAAAQFHIGNYRSSLRDCEVALRLTPTHLKAIVRGAECTFALKDFGGCEAWCDKGLKLDSSNKELVKKRKEAVEAGKLRMRDERKRAAAEKRKKQEEEQILGTIRERGIRISRRKGENPLSLEDLEPNHPAAQQKKVHVNESGQLVWPVLFLYPEHGETDFLEEFRENEQFQSHLEVMFGDQSPPWDPQSRYKPSCLGIYFEDMEEKLQEISPDMTLMQALTRKGYLVKAGTPAFIIMVKGSKAQVDFLKKYKFGS